MSYPPKVALSVLVNSLKGVSARRVRAKRFPEVTSILHGSAFWSASYCAVSCGGAPLEILKTYIWNQTGTSGDAVVGRRWPERGCLPALKDVVSAPGTR